MGMPKRSVVYQSDIRRTIRAVQAEGFSPREVRVRPTGDVSIDLGNDFEVVLDPLDEWRGRHGSTAQRH